MKRTPERQVDRYELGLEPVVALKRPLQRTDVEELVQAAVRLVFPTDS